MGNVRMRAEQINYGASNVKVALDDLDPKDLIALSERMDTIEAWKATVKAEEKTGASVEYTNALALPAVSLSAEIEASQDLHGYDHPWVGGAGKNKLNWFIHSRDKTGDGITFTESDDGIIDIDGTATNDNTYSIVFTGAEASAFSNMILNGIGADIGVFLRLEKRYSPYTKYATDYGNGATIGEIPSDGGDCILFIRVPSGTTCNHYKVKPMIRLATETDPTFAPYSNICPISGRTETRVDDVGKNLYNNEVGTSSDSGITYTKNADGTIKATGTASANSYYNMTNVVFPAGTYAFNGCPSGGADNKYKISLFNVTTQQTIGTGDIGSGNTFTANGTDEYRLFIRVNNGYAFPTGGLLFKPMVRLASITDDTYVPYAHSSVTIQLGQTVYGGTLNVTTGVLTIDRAIIDMGDLTYSYNATDKIFYATLSGVGDRLNAISTVFVVASTTTGALLDDGEFMFRTDLDRVYLKCLAYDEATQFKTAMTGQKICYELATPQTIQLTPTDLQMLKGYNRLCSDGGDITVKAYTGAPWGGDEA